MASAPAPSRRRRLTKQERRERLITAAAVVFGRDGYHGATMELVAAEGGVTRTLLYEHFASLEELYVATVRAARAELDARLVEAGAAHTGHPREQLRAGLTAYFRFVAERAASWEVLSGSVVLPPGPAGDATAELRFRTAEQIGALFGVAVPEVPAEATMAYAHAVSGAGEQLAHWWRRHPDVALERVVDYAMDAVWGGLGSFVKS